MDTNGFYGDTFSSGFGDFYTAKKRDPFAGLGSYHGETPFSQADKFYSAQPGLSAWGEAKIKVGRLEFIIFTFFIFLIHLYFIDILRGGWKWILTDFMETHSRAVSEIFILPRDQNLLRKRI